METKEPSAAEAACSRLASEGRDLLSWKWDDFFSSVLAVIKAAQQEEALALLEQAFGKSYDHLTIPQAPAPVRAVATKLGGVRPGQRILALDPDPDGGVLFCAWWPWDNKTTISVRISYGAAGEAMLRRVFGCA